MLKPYGSPCGFFHSIIGNTGENHYEIRADRQSAGTQLVPGDTQDPEGNRGL